MARHTLAHARAEYARFRFLNESPFSCGHQCVRFAVFLRENGQCGVPFVAYPNHVAYLNPSPT